MNHQRLFVTSTGTGIGKSFITASLVRQAKAVWRRAAAYKPIVTGFDPEHVGDSDTGLLLRSLDLPANEENIQRMSPWRFRAPLAPSMAARLEKRELDFDALVVHSRGVFHAPDDLALIEGVGGVMAPLDGQHTVLDWIERVGVPALLVTGSYLGSLSHTLTSLAVLVQRGVPVHAIVVNETPDSSVSVEDTAAELGRWTRLPVVPIKRRSGKDNWESVSELKTLLA